MKTFCKKDQQMLKEVVDFIIIIIRRCKVHVKKEREELGPRYKKCTGC
jgi:hypothetical protein